MASMTRIKTLERRLGSGPCPHCGGGDPNQPFEVVTNYDTPDNIVKWGPDHEPPEAA